MLRFLELPIAATGRNTIFKQNEPGDEMKLSAEGPSGLPKLAKIRKAPVKIVSNRLRGLAVTPLEIGENDSLDRTTPQLERNTGDLSHGDTKENVDSDDENAANLMSGDLFFDQETR
ncbi:hypothetical protein BGX26_007340 [Mortierella sp. AD094]|nr:hypothetical protein BGX26_007340 [Mortierella sp. AD094]